MKSLRQVIRKLILESEGINMWPVYMASADENNKRFIAITKNDNHLDKLMNEECLTRDCSVKQSDSDYSIVSIK